MFEWIKEQFVPIYETESMLRNYIRAQYGTFTTPPTGHTTENFYQQMLRISDAHIRDNACLDIGCATGRLVFEYAARGAKSATGTDTSTLFIKTCEEIKSNGIGNFQTARLHANFFVDDILHTKLKDGTYDFISCLNVLDRVENPTRLVRVVSNLLKDGGIAVFSSPLDWAYSPTSKQLQKDNLREYLDTNEWDVLDEKKDVSFDIPYGNQIICYKTQVIVAKKRGRKD